MSKKMIESKKASPVTRKPSSTAGKKRVIFQVQAPPGSEVSVAGTFNRWEPRNHLLKETKEGRFTRAVYLPPGRVEYKYMINGEWQLDPECHQLAPNEYGTSNCVLVVH